MAFTEACRLPTLPGVNKLPAVQWRQQNLDPLSKPKDASQNNRYASGGCLGLIV